MNETCESDFAAVLLNDPPCLEIATTLCEDKNDVLAACDNTLTHESPTLFLKSPNYTLEEKFAYVEKYLCGLQLSLVPNLCFNHDTKLDIVLNNYFKRGKHANEFQNKFNDPRYVPKVSKLHDLHSYIDKFSSSDCNYYERGGDKYPQYACEKYKLHTKTNNMHGYTFVCFDSFIYKMTMHRKKVRLRCYYFFVLLFSLLVVTLTIILIGLIVPWDPGIYMISPKLGDAWIPKVLVSIGKEILPLVMI